MSSHKLTYAALIFGLAAALTGCGGGGGGGGFIAPPLTDLRYDQLQAEYTTDVAILPNTPTLESGEAESFEVAPPLPEGLVLDPQTGIITGVPIETTPASDFIITARRGNESASVTLSIEVVAFAFAIGGPEDDSGRDAAALENGTTVVAGSFRGTARFGEEELISDLGSSDVLLVAFRESGELAWARRAGGPSSDAATAVAALPGGGFVAAGIFRDTAIFGPGEENQQTLTADGSSDLFVARFDSNGDLIWVRRAGGLERVTVTAIAAFSDDDVLVAGEFEGQATFGPGEANEAVLTAELSDGFLARFQSDGDLAWIQHLTGEGIEQPQAVTVASDDTSAFTGTFTDTVVFDGNSFSTPELTQDLILGKLAPNGDVIGFGAGTGFDIANGNAIGFLSDGSAVIAGMFTGTAFAGDGEITASNDAFVGRFIFEGEIDLDWLNVADGTASIPRALVVFPDDTIAVAGALIGQATFGVGQANETTLEEQGVEGDAYLARYTGFGTLQYARGIHGPETEQIGGLTAGRGDVLQVAGSFSGATTFGQGEANETTLESDLESQDAFLVRYDENGEL